MRITETESQKKEEMTNNHFLFLLQNRKTFDKNFEQLQLQNYMKNNVIDSERNIMYNIDSKEVLSVLVYKIDVLETLKEAGYSTTRLRKDKLLNESAIQYIREGKPVGAKALDNICMLLDMQPGNIIKYVENK